MSGQLKVDPEQYVGQFLDDWYFLQRELGRGAFASVYHAQRPDNTSAALKLLHTGEPLAHMRFAREIQVMQALPPSPHLVGYIGQGVLPAGGAYLAMEYVDGPTLAKQMELGPLSPEEACIVTYQIALALQPLHRYGIVHRDLKPGNVLMAPDGSAKLFDFGLVLDSEGFLKLFEEEDILQGRTFTDDLELGTVVGTPEYMAIEQFHDAGEREPEARRTCTASDIFSLGVILYRLITGQFPFPMRTAKLKPTKQEFFDYFRYRYTATPESIGKPANIDDALWSILKRALHNAVRKRQPDAKAIAEELFLYITSGRGTRQESASSTHVIDYEDIERLLEEERGFDDDLTTDVLSIAAVWPEMTSSAEMMVNRPAGLPDPFGFDDEDSITQEIDLNDEIIIEARKLAKSPPPLKDPFADDDDDQ